VRLLGEVEQILIEGDLDPQRNRAQVKAVKRGDWSLEEVESYFSDKERALEQVYVESKLPAKPRQSQIRQLLIQCVEESYGSIDKMLVMPADEGALLNDLKELVGQYEGG
jgi:hypothetical protein